MKVGCTGTSRAKASVARTIANLADWSSGQVIAHAGNLDLRSYSRKHKLTYALTCSSIVCVCTCTHMHTCVHAHDALAHAQACTQVYTHASTPALPHARVHARSHSTYSITARTHARTQSQHARNHNTHARMHVHTSCVTSTNASLLTCACTHTCASEHKEYE